MTKHTVFLFASCLFSPVASPTEPARPVQCFKRPRLFSDRGPTKTMGRSANSNTDWVFFSQDITPTEMEGGGRTGSRSNIHPTSRLPPYSVSASLTVEETRRAKVKSSLSLSLNCRHHVRLCGNSLPFFDTFSPRGRMPFVPSSVGNKTELTLFSFSILTAKCEQTSFRIPGNVKK